jgi:hypothetical protein
VAAAALYVHVESRSLYSLKPAAAAFEEANNPRPAGAPRPHHIRTPSVVLGGGQRSGGGGVNSVAASVAVALDLDLGGDSGRGRRDRVEIGGGDGDGGNGGTQGAAIVLSWEHVCVYATIITPSQPGGVIKHILRGNSGFAGPDAASVSAGARGKGRGDGGGFAALNPKP